MALKLLFSGFMKKYIFLVLMVLSVCIPAYGMKRALEPAIQEPYGGVGMVEDVISRIFALCPTSTRNVLMKVCTLYAQLATRTNTALYVMGARLPELHTILVMKMALSQSNIALLRAVSTIEDLGVLLQKNGESKRILSWLLFRMEKDKVEQFQPLLPKCVTDEYEGLLQDYPDRDIKKITAPGSVLEMGISFSYKDDRVWALRIEKLCNACQEGENTYLWLIRHASRFLKMASMRGRTECIRAMLANANYARHLKPEGDMLAQWPDLLYKACASKDTASFQLLADWLFTQPIANAHMRELIKNIMTQVIDINRHQHLRIVVAKGRTIKDFDIWAKELLWYAFIHKKYDSVDTLLEYLSLVVQSQQLPVSEPMRRCKQVIEVVFTETIYYLDVSTEVEALCTIELLCTKDQQHCIKMIIEKIRTYSYFNEIASPILAGALKQKNYEIVRMIFAWRDHFAKGPSMLPMSTWERLLGAIGEQTDVDLFSNVLECGFWPVMHGEPISISDVDPLQKLFMAFGINSIASNDLRFLEALLVVGQRGQRLFAEQITEMLENALEKGAYESIKLLLTCGACQHKTHNFMLSILKEAGVSNIAVQVPDYVLSLKQKKPDLFQQLASTSAQTYMQKQRLAVEIQALVELQKKKNEEQAQLASGLENAIRTTDVVALESILTAGNSIQPVVIERLVSCAQACKRECDASLGNIDYLMRLGRHTHAEAVSLRRPHEQKGKCLDTIIQLLSSYQTNDASSSAFV